MQTVLGNLRNILAAKGEEILEAAAAETLISIFGSAIDK